MEWTRVKDGLPDCPTMKPEGKCWDVYDSAGGVRVSNMHPDWWNRHDKSGIVEIVTHWRERPEPPL